MKQLFLLSSDNSSIFFNLLLIILLIISFKKNKRYIPFLSIFVYLFILVFWKVNLHEAYILNKLISSTLFLLYISQGHFSKLRFKHQKIIYAFSLVLFLPYIGILNLYNPTFLRQTFFAFATLGFVLLYNPLFFARGKLMIIIMFIVNVTSLAKWLIIYYTKNILLFLKSEKVTFKIFIKGIGVLLVGYYILNFSIGLAGYESIDNFIIRRVTKIEAQNYEQQHIMGISDGNRINIALSQFYDFVYSKKKFGLGLDYTNRYEVSEHNIFIFLITRFGIFGILLSIVFIIKFIKSFKSNRGLILFYLHVFLAFMVGEYYGSPIAIFSAILTHYLISKKLPNQNE